MVLGGGAARNVVSVEVIRSNPPDRHLKVLPGSFLALSVFIVETKV